VLVLVPVLVLVLVLVPVPVPVPARVPVGQRPMGLPRRHCRRRPPAGGAPAPSLW
jgi:hypothetical protein